MYKMIRHLKISKFNDEIFLIVLEIQNYHY